MIRLNKKAAVGFQLSLLIISTFAFAFILSESNLVSADNPPATTYRDNEGRIHASQDGWYNGKFYPKDPYKLNKCL